MWQLVILLFPVASALIVCVCCSVLLVQGIRFIFVYLFGAAAALQLLVRVYVLSVAPRAITLLGYGGVASTVFYIAGWISLTYLLLQARKTSQHNVTSGV